MSGLTREQLNRIGVVMLLITLVLGLAVFVRAAGAIDFNKRAEDVEAIIESVEPYSKNTRHVDPPSVVDMRYACIRYTYDNVVYRSGIPQDRSMKKGDRITIKVDPKDPTKIRDPYDKGMNTLIAAFLMSFGISVYICCKVIISKRQAV